MKNIFFSIIALATVVAITVSCNQSSSKNSDKTANDSTVVSDAQNVPSSTQNDTATSTAPVDTLAKAAEKSDVKKQAQNFSIAPIITDYLSLKNALASDNDKAAANAGKQLFITLKNVDMKTIPANKQGVYGYCRKCKRKRRAYWRQCRKDRPPKRAFSIIKQRCFRPYSIVRNYPKIVSRLLPDVQ